MSLYLQMSALVTGERQITHTTAFQHSVLWHERHHTWSGTPVSLHVCKDRKGEAAVASHDHS